MFNPDTELPEELEVAPGQAARRAFYSKLLSALPGSLQDDLTGLCRAWIEAVGGEWCWLWLKHTAPSACRPWEIIASIGRGAGPKGYAPRQLVPDDHDLSVAEYCTSIGKAILVSDPESWKKATDDSSRRYRVVSLSDLQSMGCKSFIAVPLRFPSASGRPFSSFADIYGVVCIHWLEKVDQLALQSQESLLLMGKATSQSIAVSYAAFQYRLLYEHDALATKYLTMRSGRPAENRSAYLAEVIALIQAQLRVESVSVFYRTLRDPTLIECIASTGLYSEKGRLADFDLSQAKYKRGVGITGKVFAANKPFVSTIGVNPRAPKEVPRWRETEAIVDERMLPWTSYPIRTPSAGASQKADAAPFGVLRCVGNRPLLASTVPRNYDPFQLEAIDFIAGQMAPVLETMAVQIARERSVTVIKHDLYAPLKMIEDQVDVLDSNLREGQSVAVHWYGNVKAAVVLARNLAGSLSEQDAFTPRPTNLEQDIVARLKDALRRFAKVESGMSIEFENIKESIPTLIVDRNLVERALTNLLKNAIKYGMKGTTIRVYGEEVAYDYLLHVSNFGLGVSEEEAERIFDGEYRSPRFSAIKEGLGLGLKIAKGAMLRHGGNLALTSLRDPTTFTMSFPKRLMHYSRPG